MGNLNVMRDPQRPQEMEGCIRLWASVIRKAADDYFVEHHGESLKARCYFASNRHDIGSFLWCCDALNLNPEAVRESLANGTARRVKAKYAGLVAMHNKGRDKPATRQERRQA